jgi:hypothetical protein
MTAPRAGYTAVLTGLAFLFLLRVLGQVLVALFDVGFLPPMAEWYSGLVPYPVLLAAQVAILALLASVCRDVARGTGVWARPRPRLGRWLRRVSYGYAGAMLVRYAVLRTGAIPVVFHGVLAAFLFTLGRYQERRRRPGLAG